MVSGILGRVHRYPEDDGLKRMEFRYRLMLGKCDLVGELGPTEEELDAITQSLNDCFSDEGDRGDFRTLQLLCQTYPATIAVFLTFSAVHAYASETANYWDGVWERLAWKRTERNKLLLATTFAMFIEESNLIEHRGGSRHWVDPILLHAAIPVRSLPNFFEHVIALLAREPNLSLAEIPEKYLLRPVKDFLRAGGRVAENLVDRCVNLYRYLQTRIFGVEGQTEALQGQFGLAAHVVHAMIKWAADRVRNDNATASHRSMRVVFDPYRSGITLEVPSAELTTPNSQPKFLLRTSATVTEQEAVLDYSSSVPRTRPMTLRAPEPSPYYEITLSNEPYQSVTRGIKADAPTFFEVGSGRRLPDGPLPADHVWAVVPKTLTPEGSGTGGVVLEELPSLPGKWREMRALTLDTRGETYLDWKDQQGKRVDELTRLVEEHEATIPKLRGETLRLPFASSDHVSVFAGQAPHLWLPVQLDEGEGLKRWSIRGVSVEESRTELFAISLADLHDGVNPVEDGLEVDLASPELLGDFFGTAQVLVQGPLGRDAKLSLVVIPGVKFTVPDIEHIRLQDGKPKHFPVLIEGAGSLRVEADGAAIMPAPNGWKLEPDSESQEIVVRLSRSSASSSQAVIPIRVSPFEWGMVNLETESEVDWGVQRLSHPAGNVEDLMNRGLVVKSYFSAGGRHSLTLYANGEKIQTVTRRWLTNTPQKSRFDLAEFADSIRGNAAAELILVLNLETNGAEWEVQAAEVEFDWRVEDLTVSLVDRGLYYIKASWTDISPPKARRKLLLRDRWRPGKILEFPISGDDVTLSALIREDDLPPGRYEVDFSAIYTWTGKGRKPVAVNPSTVLSVRQEEWDGLLSDPQTPREWLLAANVFLDYPEAKPPSGALPPKESWSVQELAALAHVIESAVREGRIRNIIDSLDAWRPEDHLAVCDALLAELPGSDVRTVAVGLYVHRKATICDHLTRTRPTYDSWPTLGVLHGERRLPAMSRAGRKYAWGYSYKLRDPLSYHVGPKDIFDPSTPSSVLADWLRAGYSRRGLETKTLELMGAMEEITKYYARSRRILEQNTLTGSAGLLEGYDDLREVLSVHPDSSVAPLVALAFVDAGVALWQRFVAWEWRARGPFDRYPSWEPLCALCPPLHDYYLLLAEYYIRRAARPDLT